MFGLMVINPACQTNSGMILTDANTNPRSSSNYRLSLKKFLFCLFNIKMTEIVV